MALKGWYGDKLRHRLASRGILTTIENRGESYYFGDLTIHEKKHLGQSAEDSVISLLKRNTSFEITDVSKLQKGLGDIKVEIKSDCGDYLSLVEVKNVESLHKHEVGKIAISPRGHKALIKNAEEMGAIPVYIVKVNEDLGEGIFESRYYWKKAELFTGDINRMRGKWFTQVIHKALIGAEPVDESFDFFLKDCNRVVYNE